MSESSKPFKIALTDAQFTVISHNLPKGFFLRKKKGRTKQMQIVQDIQENSPDQEQFYQKQSSQVNPFLKHSYIQGQKMIKDQIDTCRQILAQIKKKKFSEQFRFPVDALALGIPHYYQVVKMPMDLKSMSQKIDRNQYAVFDQFYDDLKLISKNCIKFNYDSPYYIKRAEVFLTQSKKIIDKYYNINTDEDQDRDQLDEKDIGKNKLKNTNERSQISQLQHKNQINQNQSNDEILQKENKKTNKIKKTDQKQSNGRKNLIEDTKKNKQKVQIEQNSESNDQRLSNQNDSDKKQYSNNQNPLKEKQKQQFQRSNKQFQNLNQKDQTYKQNCNQYKNQEFKLDTIQLQAASSKVVQTDFHPMKINQIQQKFQIQKQSHESPTQQSAQIQTIQQQPQKNKRTKKSKNQKKPAAVYGQKQTQKILKAKYKAYSYQQKTQLVQRVKKLSTQGKATLFSNINFKKGQSLDFRTISDEKLYQIQTQLCITEKSLAVLVGQEKKMLEDSIKQSSNKNKKNQ